MGTGWRSSYDKSVQVLSASQVSLHRANGQTITFSGGAWISTLPVGVLTQIAGGWQYVNRRNAIETYDSVGKLVSLAKAGLVTTIQYDASNRLYKAINPFGKTLTYAYDAGGRMSTVTLPDGNTVSYSYDTRNNLVTVRFPDNSVKQYLYENSSFPNALTGVIDEAGRRRFSWGYDSSGRPSMGSYGVNVNTVNIAYSGSNVTVTDARGAQRTRTFSTIGGRVVLTNIQTAATATTATTAWSFNYDANGNPLTVTTRSGQVRQYMTDAKGRVTIASKAAGTSIAQSSSVTWHPIFRKPVQTTRLGVTRNFTVDAYGRTTLVTKSGGGLSSTLISKIFSTQNLLSSVTDARGATFSFTYDSSGNISSVTNSLAGTSYFQNYNANGQAGLQQRADGVVITRAFDLRGRVVSRTVAGMTTSFTYDQTGRVNKVAKSDGSWRGYSYDSSGSLSAISNHRGEAITLTRDLAGKITQSNVYSSAGVIVKLSTKEYNAIGRLTGIVDARGYRKQISYANDGRPSAVTNAVGQTKGFQLDILSRLTATTQPNTAVTVQLLKGLGKTSFEAATAASTNTFNTASLIQAVADVNSVGTGYGYDSLNRRLAESNVDGGNRSVARSAVGDVVSSTDSRGVSVSVTRDALGRVTSITPPTGAATSFTYVAGRSDSLPASMTDASGSTVWTYDSAGRVLTKQQSVASYILKTTLIRDTLGRVISIAYPMGANVGITYAADVVSSIVVNSTTLLSNITYRPFSNVPAGWTWGNGTLYKRTFDTDGRITGVTLGTATRSYSYDGAGRMSGFTDTGTAGTKASAFAYDAADQLSGYSAPGLNLGYAYDTNGNRLSHTYNAGSYAYNYVAGTNRLASALTNNYAYNADGSPSSIGASNYTYDAFGRLTTFAIPADMINATYTYNGLGQRVSKLATYKVQTGIPLLTTGATPSPTMSSASSNATKLSTPTQITSTPGTAAIAAVTYVTKTSDSRRFFYDDSGQLMSEWGLVGDPSQDIISFGNIPVAAVRAGVIYYINADHLNTPRSIVRASDNFEMWRWDSDPFGSFFPTNPVGVAFKFNLRFPGQYQDQESYLNYNWMRYYNPSTGRYIQADPIGLSGGNNRYGYVKGNPLLKTDPKGLSSLCFNRSSSTLTVYSSDGSWLNAFPAANNVGTGIAPWPNGSYPYSHYNRHGNDANPNSAYGSFGIFVFSVPGRSGVGVHSGRANRQGYQSNTLGCVRTTDDGMDNLTDLDTDDPVTSINIGDDCGSSQ
jgi:RHS repeat-associated protein